MKKREFEKLQNDMAARLVTEMCKAGLKREEEMVSDGVRSIRFKCQRAEGVAVLADSGLSWVVKSRSASQIRYFSRPELLMGAVAVMKDDDQFDVNVVLIDPTDKKLPSGRRGAVLVCREPLMYFAMYRVHFREMVTDESGGVLCDVMEDEHGNIFYREEDEGNAEHVCWKWIKDGEAYSMNMNDVFVIDDEEKYGIFAVEVMNIEEGKDYICAYPEAPYHYKGRGHGL